MFTPVFRIADRQDALHLAALLDSASRGLVMWLWQTMCAPGQSAIELGRTRIRDEEALPSHFSKWMVATIDGEIAGALAGYVVSDPYHASDVAELPHVYGPMLELESRAVGTWYIMTLAVFPEFRNKGTGTAMLDKAAELAREAGRKKLAVMLVSSNRGAMRLYRRQGFVEVERRPYIPFPGSKDSGDWVLLMKEV